MRPCWAQYLLWLVISIMGIGAMLTSCGQKGDLYLPKKSAPPHEVQPEIQPEVPPEAPSEEPPEEQK